MPSMKELFGDNILTKDGEKPTDEVLQGKKTVGIYFSAHWCPPCRGFTPVLADFYDGVAEENNLEIIFASSDSDDHSFTEYFASMPWKAVPFSNQAIKQSLASRYGIRGIPALIVVRVSDGEVVDKDGRNTVVSAKHNHEAVLAKWN